MSAWQGPPEGWACSGSGAMRSNNLSPLAALYVTPKSLPLVRVEGHNISQSCSGDEQVRGQLSHLAALRDTPNWLWTLPNPMIGLPGGHGQCYGVVPVKGKSFNHFSHLAAL